MDDLKGRNLEIMRLRYESGLTYKEIGSIYNISRQRVQQITTERGGDGGQVFYNIRKRKIESADKKLTNQDIAQQYGVSVLTVSKHRYGWHVIGGSHSAGTGNFWEGWVADLLLKRGFAADLQSLGSYFDILVNSNIKVDVKSSNPLFCPSMKGKAINPRYSFVIRKNINREPVDFYICVAIDVQDVFIIPYSCTPNWSHIQFSWPTKRPEIGKYQKYHNRFDLLNNFKR